MQQKIAWVLSGGGAKGSFQVGVMRRLTERGIIPDAVYGCSVGALNATAYTYAGVDEMEKVWLGINRRSDIVTFQLSAIALMSRGLFSTKPLRKLIDKIVRKYPVPTITPTAVITHIETGEVGYVTPHNADNYKMSYVDAVVASASMPFVMEPINGVWVDGGIRETVPLSKAIHDGATDIYVVVCNPWVRDLDEVERVSNWFNVVTNMIDILTHEVFINDVQTCLHENDVGEKRHINLHLYAPEKKITGTLDFDPDSIRDGITRGYYAQEIEHELVRSR